MKRFYLIFALILSLKINAIEVVMSPTQGGSAVYSGSYASATYTAIPNNGYIFDHWELWNNKTNALICTYTNNQTNALSSDYQGSSYQDSRGKTIQFYKLIAYFKEKVEPTYVISIEAVSSECSKFVRWSDNDTSNPRELTVTKDSTLTAIFEQIEFNVTVDTKDATKGKVVME